MPHAKIAASTLRPLVGDLRQFASVRRLVLDDGPERGVPVLALSSGGGLDLWLLAGRGLDIGPLWFRGLPLAWQSPAGFAHPALSAPESDGGRGFERLISGFLCTCGLDRIRAPGEDGPLHGRLGAAPARVLSATEHWDRDEPLLEVVAEVLQYRLGGESLRLRRTVRMPIGGIGGNSFTIEDQVSNEGAQPQPHALLYHFNLGHPSIADGTRVQAGGQTFAGPIRLPDHGPLADARCLPAPADGIVRVETPMAHGRGLVIEFEQDSSTLPWLQLWQNLRPGYGVLAVEPCTSDRLPASAPQNASLMPGEARSYRVTVRFGETG